jgi:L-aspartate oxidase
MQDNLFSGCWKYLKTFSLILERFLSDYLIIGSGIAGLNLALRMADSGHVNVISKTSLDETNTNYAQGGIASVTTESDSFESHISDTLTAGAGLCHRDAVEVMVTEGPNRINDLIEWGVAFSKSKGNSDYELAREGGHSVSRIFHVKDFTGAEIQRVLLQRAREHPNIELFEDYYAIDLITDHHVLGNLQAAFNICFGAYVFSKKEKKVHIFRSSYTILATGGGSRVFQYSTNPEASTGDGVAMAYRAGVRIANMEFVQFHPTALFEPGHRLFLISEALRGFGGIIKNLDGEPFVKKYNEKGELAPRDIVSRAIDSEMKKRRGDHVWLDMTHLDGEKVKLRFPKIYEYCLKEIKIDISKDPIPVVPAAHYLCGGIMTSLNGQTSMQNLFVCGETAHTGVHGANRLASNSLLEALVFSYRISEKLKIKQKRNFGDVLIPDWDETGVLNLDEWFLIKHNLQQIQSLMWNYVGIVRSKQTLQRAFRRIKLIYEETENYYQRTKISSELLELRNMTAIAYMIILSALRRNESRGCHFMTDFPQSNEKFLKDTII